MIRKDDRVSTVLRVDESLVEVFVGLSPAFERLRNPGMRKVMSRLVTVEQAARLAGVDADDLVARLNRAGGATDASANRDTPSTIPSSSGAPTPDPAPSGSRLPQNREGDDAGLPARLAGLAPDALVEVDVREDLRNGREPFSRIMAARRQVPPGGALVVRAIFEPVPLYAVMEKQGLVHHTEELGPEDWRVWFHEASAPGDPRRGESTTAPETAATQVDAAATGDGVVVLDVRGLEPPEPMMRTLGALEELPPDGTLVQVNVRVPQFLLPRLDELGYAYEIREQGPDLVRLFIRRAHDG